jgi:inhibitor of KinA sporulation pathway (predicted exonuclease)
MFAIIDLEWTSWKNSLKRNWSLPWEKKEIIQIGTIKFYSQNKIIKKSIIVKPKINNNLSYYVQKLTGISQLKMNTRSINFERALLDLSIFYRDTKKIFCNGLDKEILEENCKIHNVNYPFFLKKIINIGPEISKELSGNSLHFTSGDLNKKIGIKNLKKHDALNDCMNILNFLRKFDIY